MPVVSDSRSRTATGVPEGGLWDIPDEPESYRTAAALPYCNRERASCALRGQLRLVAGADDAAPDWTALVIDGPTPLPDVRGHLV
jgi:hypothetical protein